MFHREPVSAGQRWRYQFAELDHLSVVDFANSPDFPPGVDPECFVEFWLDNGGPESFTIRSDKTIGEDSANPNLGDGTGLDHIEDAFGPLLGAALGACTL